MIRFYRFQHVMDVGYFPTGWVVPGKGYYAEIPSNYLLVGLI